MDARRQVHLEFDQPAVAHLLAIKLSGGVTCAHVAAAVKLASDAYRASLVDRVAPLCVDLRANAALISAELTEWQRITTSDALEGIVRPSAASTAAPPRV